MAITKKGWIRTARRMLMHVASTYGAASVALFLLQSCLVYQPDIPTRKIVATPASIGLDYASLKITTENGLILDAWFVPAQDARGILLFFHGNAGNISHRLYSIRIFNKLRLSTFIFDYRGFGQSEGEPSEVGTYRDAEAVWRYLTERRHVPKDKIVLFGRSLGGAIAAHTASHHQARALILESAFTSVPDMAAELYWFFPARWLVRMNYSTKAALESVSSPVLVIHSIDDELVPYSHGQALFDAAREPKRFLKLRGGHNAGFLQSRQDYLAGLEDFLATYLER